MTLPAVTIYTDGACSGNPGPGGWGALLCHPRSRKTLQGGEQHTTNNRMELTAAISALEHLKRPCSVTLCTDSRYLQQGIREWLAQWRQKGWRTASGQPVKNLDLWQRLETAAHRHQVSWHWVAGHSGDPGNEEADRLARAAIPR